MADTVLTNIGTEERGLARVAQRMAAWTEKWFPDAYIFALAGVVIVAVAAMAIGASPRSIAESFGNGFWDLTAFTLQMAMVVLTGYVVATSPPVAKLINRLAMIPATARTAVSFVALMSMSVSFLDWGLSLIFGGLLARAIARRKDLTVDYRALGAAAFMGLGAVWALGLSSSAAQLQATVASLPPALLKITGILDFGATIFTWQSLLTLAILMAVTTVIAHFSAPQGGAIRTAEDLGVDLDDEPSESAPRSRPGEWLEYSMILPILAGVLTLGWLVSQFLTKPFLTVVSSLNGYLLVFLILGLVLHGTPGKFLQAVTKAVPATDVQMNLGWTVQIYNIAEALPNLINPFFMLPLLAVLRLRAHDLVGFTFLQFVFHLPVVLLLVWLLGMTFQFVPPVMPAGQ